ncbi:MAG: alpha/beta fold hydrolase, partial [Sphingopyxis sp.]|nr:alpha/beta fold hydrolase [Sphingopyxis sp.]
MSEAGIRKSYVDTSGGQIHVRSMAGEGVPVVFFHQTASSGQMWLKTMQRLKGEWPMHALDTPGFGGSFDVPEDHYPSMTEYVGWLGEAVRALGITKCHVVGHHTGSCIGVELAARQPDLVA